jgi:nucleotide-binding universal stress UspA family protein
MAEQFNAELHIIHVIPPPLSPDFTLVLPTDVPLSVGEPEMIAACKKSLEHVIDTYFGADRRIKYVAFFGNPWTGICDYARDKKIDLIVLPTHGRTGLGHMLIGSTAERVVQHAPCTVLTVKKLE